MSEIGEAGNRMRMSGFKAGIGERASTWLACSKQGGKGGSVEVRSLWQKRRRYPPHFDCEAQYTQVLCTLPL